MTRLLIALLLILPATGIGQQIFRTKDAQGNVIFTDQPPPDSAEVREVELNPTNSAQPPTSRPLPAVSAKPTEPEPIVFSVEIIAPDNETTIAMGPGNFSVSARVNPAPGPGESLQLKLDGANRGEPQQSNSWQLTNVFRGSHDVTVSIIDAKGAALATSEPIRVYVLRPSSNFRR